MDVISIFEKLAKTAHFKMNQASLTDLPPVIKEALIKNDQELLKQHFCDVEYLANEVDIINLKI